jgi:uncharacterized phage protein (TIGR02218 family)
MRAINPVSATSAFWLKMQGDSNLLTELIDLELPGGTNYRFTTTNAPLTYTLSAAPTIYVPFPGATPTGVEESADMGVSIIDFLMVNTFNDVMSMLDSDDFKSAVIKVGRVFTDTPDLGRMEIYYGQMGDFVHDRLTIKGQVRNQWKSMGVRWPYYTYQDKCNWRFGGTGCGFNTASVTVALNSIQVGSSTTLALLVASGYLVRSYSNGRFDFGKLTVTAGANSGHVRTIRSHSGDLLGLSHTLPNSDLSGMQLSIYPGCRKRLIDDCKSLYNNDKNFLGWPWIPAQEQGW